MFFVSTIDGAGLRTATGDARLAGDAHLTSGLAHAFKPHRDETVHELQAV